MAPADLADALDEEGEEKCGALIVALEPELEAAVDLREGLLEVGVGGQRAAESRELLRVQSCL